MVPIVDGELLRAFAAFADELNFTRAARRIGLSQPALFERVRRLSEQVGPLYRKEGRTLHLTPNGVEVAAFARAELARGRALVARLQGRTRACLTLAAGKGSYLYLLRQALVDFPIELELLTLGGPSAADAVLRGRADVAFGSWDVLPPELTAHPVLQTGMCAAVREDHPLAGGATLADLGRYRLILAPEGQRHRDVVGRAVAAVAGPLQPPLTADGWPLMLAFAAMGQGVAVVNGTCDPPPGVVLVPLPELGTLTYALVHRTDRDPDGLDELRGRLAEKPRRSA